VVVVVMVRTRGEREVGAAVGWEQTLHGRRRRRRRRRSKSLSLWHLVMERQGVIDLDAVLLLVVIWRIVVVVVVMKCAADE